MVDETEARRLSGQKSEDRVWTFFGRHCSIQNLNFESCHIKSNESSKSVGFVTLVLLLKLFANPEE